MLINHDLAKIYNIRKILQYEEDKKWSKEEAKISGVENNFKSFSLMFPRVEREVKVGVGICMDINFKDFEESRYTAGEAVLAEH